MKRNRWVWLLLLLWAGVPCARADVSLKFSGVLWLAYIDPGTGSMLLQFIIAGAVGVVAYFRKFIFGMFRTKRERPAVAEKPEDKTQA
jgi:hypothetical protein